MRIDVSAEEVMRAVAAYLVLPGDDPAEAVAAARKFGLLPLCNDMGGCVLLSPAGDIVAFAWDAPEELKPLSDRFVHAVRGKASSRFRTITGLAPCRPTDAVVCPGCHGTGVMAKFPKVICLCGGLGWLPPDLVAVT
jgi:hypothetical protein